MMIKRAPAASRLPLSLSLLVWLALLVLPGYAGAQQPEPEPELLLFEVRLGQSVLSEAIPAFDGGEHVLLPLGELTRLLTIAIQTDPGQGTASGFVLDRQRDFSLNLADARVSRAGVMESFDPSLVRSEPDDIYVAAALLERWLPLELEADRSSLTLRVHPLEELPLQARLERERLGERASRRGGYQDPNYPHHEDPYRLLSIPFIDQTLALETRRSDAGTRTEGRYTALLTGDLLGMESSIYLNHDTAGDAGDLRATFGRHDTEGELLGPLHARSFQFGSLSAPSVDNISRGINGEGITLSNRPLSRPTQFDRQTFEGDLPPGWDVELFYNGALVGFQQPNADGRYRFEDQPISYGRNDFQLVFHGPLGQTRVERQSFSLAESMMRPGEFQYSLTEHRDEDGEQRSIAQFDLGLARYLSATGGFIRAPVNGIEHRYSQFGLRTFWQSLSLNAELTSDEAGGTLQEFGLQTRLFGVSMDASRLLLDEFQSNALNFSGDPLRTRDELRLTGSIPAGARSVMPVTILARRDAFESGRLNQDLSARISGYAYRTALSNTLRWQSLDGQEFTSGDLQISRNYRDIGLRGQLSYLLGPEAGVSSVALTADKNLAEGYRLSLGLAHNFNAYSTSYTAGFTKSIGRFGLGLSASYLDTGDVAVGMQLFLAMGREPRQSDWLFDAQPMANAGSASVRMFLDDNNNGLMDPGEEPLEGAGFTVNGGAREVRTDANGIAHIGRLPVKQRVDIGVDSRTLADPMWQPQVAGLSVQPRPGRVSQLDFPVRMTTEIDGTVYLLEHDNKRGIGALEMELVDANNQVVAKTTSSWDGFYILTGVVAGDYLLRASPEQLQRLGLIDTGARMITVSGDGTFVSGMDLLVMPKKKATSQERQAAN